MKNIGASAPRKLIAFLIGTRCENYSRARAAQALECSQRSIDRALGCLVGIGAIVRQSGGRSTPAKIRVLMTIEQATVALKKLSRYVAATGALSLETVAPNGAYNLRYLRQERKPPCMEQLQNHHEPGEVDAPQIVAETPQKPAWTAQERALYARFQREYPFASQDQFAAYKRECEAA